MQALVKKLTVIHFYYFIALAGLAVAYDAWKLITPQALMDRWMVALLLLTTSVIVWFMTRQVSASNKKAYTGMVWALVLVDIAVAGFGVYQQRGVSSLAVGLFVIPLIVVSVLRSNSALTTVATLSAAAYSFAVIKYTVDFPGEEFRITMYGEIFFWGIMFYILAGMIAVVTNSKST